MTTGPISAQRRRMRADIAATRIMMQARPSHGAAAVEIETAMLEAELATLKHVANIFEGDIQITMTGRQIAQVILDLIPQCRRMVAA